MDKNYEQLYLDILAEREASSRIYDVADSFKVNGQAILKAIQSGKSSDDVLAMVNQMTDGMSERVQSMGGNRWADLVDLYALTPEDLRFAWRGAVPMGCTTLMPAQPGMGKSTFLNAVVSWASSGRINMLGETVLTEPSKVLIIGGEDNVASIVKPTLLVNGAELSNIRFCSKDNRGRRFTFDDRDIWRSAMESFQPKIVIIDNLFKFNPAKSSDVRSGDAAYDIIGFLDELAAEYDSGLILVHHTPKKKNEDDSNVDSYGGQQWIGAVRSVLQIKRGPDPSRDRIVFQSKENMVVKLKPTLFSSEPVAVPGWNNSYYKYSYHGEYRPDEEVGIVKPKTKQDFCNDDILNAIREHGLVARAELLKHYESKQIARAVTKYKLNSVSENGVVKYLSAS